MSVGNTFNAMVAQIVFELGQRTDLQATVVPRAINDAIQIWQKERFRFNENRPLTPFTINTVANQYIYTALDDPRIAQLFLVDYINYLLGSTNNKMHREVPESIYLATINGTASGPPGWWAYDGNSIAIYPAPNQVYQLTVGGYWVLAGPLASDYGTDTANPWMNEAERLIRCQAKYIIARDVTRNKDMMQAMSPMQPQNGEDGHATYWAFRELKSEANKIRGTSRVRGMKF